MVLKEVKKRRGEWENYVTVFALKPDNLKFICTFEHHLTVIGCLSVNSVFLWKIGNPSPTKL